MSARKSAPSTKRRLGILLCLIPALGGGGCVDYLKHSDRVTSAAGDAQDWNKVVHTADPWPPYAANTRITGDGRRVAKVAERYIAGEASDPAQPQSLAPAGNAAGGASPPQ